MSDEKKETKCCGCCKGVKKELSNEDLDKVTGGNGNGWQNGKYICLHYKRLFGTCMKNKTVDGVANVCVCVDKTNGVCCDEYGDNCTCSSWDKKSHTCLGD